MGSSLRRCPSCSRKPGWWWRWSHVLMPYMVMAVWASLQRLDPQIENAAVALGAGPITTLRRIVLPQVMPGILSGA